MKWEQVTHKVAVRIERVNSRKVFRTVPDM